MFWDRFAEHLITCHAQRYDATPVFTVAQIAFFGCFISKPFIHPYGTCSSLRIWWQRSKRTSTDTSTPALITSGSVLSHPGAYPFFNFFIAFLISARVMRLVFMFRSSLGSISGGMGGSSWLFTPLDYPITELEIRTAVKKLKNNKSPYSDKIRNEMIKASLNEMMPVYHKLFNNILNWGSMPLMWCSGLITPIFKSGGRNDPTNYRGICVSSCSGKLFCSILNQRLMEHVNSLNILHNSQIGFLPNNWTADHALTLRTLINKSVHCHQEKGFACFVDFRRAFDSVYFGMMGVSINYYK